MIVFEEKLKPILKDKEITIVELGKRIGKSRQQLYNVGKQSLVDSGLLNLIADELQIDRSVFDEFRHASVLQSQTANNNEQSTVSQTIGQETSELKALYERLLTEKDEQIKVLKEMIELLKR